MKRFNLNDKMYVQITPEGHEHLKNTKRLEYINAVIGRSAVAINNELWCELQGHDVLNLFGGKISHQSPIKMNIMFDEEDLREV